MPHELVPFDRDRHDRSSFDCGEQSLDRYLKQQATQDMRRDLCTVYVLAEQDVGRILAYYTLSATAIRRETLPSAAVRRLPCYDAYPAVLIGRLAVDSTVQGQHVGSTLVNDALLRALQLADRVGVHAVVVDALHDRAAAFYRKFGFIPFVGNDLRLFLSIADIRAAFMP